MSETPEQPSVARGAAAGVVAAATWLVSESLIRQFTRLDYGDARLLGRLVTPKGPWMLTGVAIHLANGAAFGALFAALGGRGWRQGLVAAQLENAALWPAFVVVDRIHEDRRNGNWPPLATDPRIIGHEVAGHAVFGLVLGALTTRRAPG